MPNKKEDFLDQMKKQFDDLNYRWSRERDKFEAGIQHAGTEVIKEYEAKREEYLRFRKDLNEKIVDLEVAGDNAWYDLKEGVEISWKALGEAFDKATSHFKK
jgi:hypothetical protein